MVKAQNWCQSSPECDKYIRIFSIRIFVRIKILIRIYSDIRLYQNFDTNIFGYSFVSKHFLQIYSDIRSCHFLDTNIFGYSFVSKSIRMSHSDPEFTQRLARMYEIEAEKWAWDDLDNLVWGIRGCKEKHNVSLEQRWNMESAGNVCKIKHLQEIYVTLFECCLQCMKHGGRTDYKNMKCLLPDKC